MNARVGIEGPDADWGIYAFVTHLFDKIGCQRLTAVTGEGPARNWTSAISAQPRTWGVNVRKRF